MVRNPGFLLISLLIYGFFLFGLATLHGELVAAAIPLIVYLGCSLLTRPGQLRLEAVRTIFPERAMSGSAIAVKVQVTNQGSDVGELMIEDQIPFSLSVSEGESHVLLALKAGETVELNYTLTGPRGEYQFQEVRATAWDRLGSSGSGPGDSHTW
jgi:uncharacterized protein (DUF58 family)